MAPWALGAGLLVSFTASAGYENTIGASVIERLGSRDVPALPPGERLIESNLGAWRAEPPATLARLPLDLSAPSGAPEAQPGPRGDLKSRARVFPLVDRTRKGDALVVLRATLSQRAEALRAEVMRGEALRGEALRGEALRGEALRAGGGGLRPGGPAAVIVSALTPGPAVWVAERDGEPGFVPWPADDRTLTDPATAPSSPLAAGSDLTGARATRTPEGTTPAVPRAVALSSATPAPADAVPLEVAAAAVSLPRLERDGRAGTTLAARPESEAPAEADRARYADLISPETAEREQRCLAEAVYFEARGESEEGQAAVAQVVLNRAKSGLYPASICGVVYQNRHRYMGCQFSFACEGRSLRVADGASWQTASRVARAVVEGRTYLAEVGGATHYHADYVRPSWSRRLTRMDAIGRHIFYKLKPGQT